MIGIIDYGASNLKSVVMAFSNLGASIKILRQPSELRSIDKLVLPGVGAFGDAIDNLKQSNWIEKINAWIKKGNAYLGICLGLQLLFCSSEESPSTQGLSLLRGKVVSFSRNSALKIPHMGWNQMHIRKKNCHLFKGIKNNSYFYFLHSYHASPLDIGVVAGETEYGINFPSVIWKQNIYAVQFHPEKSGIQGQLLLQNFMRTPS